MCKSRGQSSPPFFGMHDPSVTSFSIMFQPHFHSLRSRSHLLSVERRGRRCAAHQLAHQLIHFLRAIAEDRLASGRMVQQTARTGAASRAKAKELQIGSQAATGRFAACLSSTSSANARRMQRDGLAAALLIHVS